MLLKPLETPDEWRFEGLNVLKVGFLVVTLGAGIFLATNQPSPQELAQRKKQYQAQRVLASSRITPTPAANLDELKEQVSEQGAVIADETFKIAQATANDVLGEATTAIQNTASESAGVATDYMYQSTVGFVINHLIETLPEKQREDFKENFCKP